MDNEYDSDLSSEDEVGLIENLVYLRWKPKHDQSPFVGNEKRVICAIKTSENIVDIYLHSSFTCLEFYDVNFNNYPISFWQTQGSRMKSLKLDHCIVDLNTLTCIVEYCANLRAFEFRTSDLFIRDENASFGIVLNRLIEQRLEVPSVETLILEMDKSQNSACSMDQSILNMLLLFPNLKKLTLIHNCELRNFPNYSPIKISDSAESDGRTWDQILNLLVSRLPRFEAINLEFGSIVFSRSVWDYVMHNRNKLRRLKELTFELVPSEQRYPEIKNWYTFLVSQRKLKTITCKLRLESSPIESDFLNKFLRHILKKCSSLQHLKVEQLKLDMGQPHSRWDMDYEFLRDVLASNLKSIQIRVECCDLYLNDDKSELEPWWNDTVELLSLNYARSAPNGRQHATMALFLSKFTSLKHLHLNGDINDVVLNAIWTHQHAIEKFTLHCVPNPASTLQTFLRHQKCIFQTMGRMAT